MDKSMLLRKRLEDGRLKVKKQPRICLFPGCTKNAIKSHVLQEREILKGIVDDTNHFYSIGHVPIFEMTADNLFKVSRVGINKGYTFPGFCNDHDSEIFKEIETHPIDLTNKRNQALFTYRTACLEFRKQEIYLDLSKDLLKAHLEIEPEKTHIVFLQPAQPAIEDMKFYKSELEAQIIQGNRSNFEIDVVELQERQICFSAAISIEDPSNEFTSDVDQYGFLKEDPLAVSVLNYFPYRGKSYLIAAHHKKYFCNWTKSVVAELREGTNPDKIISDILTYRLEFWGIAPQLYESIPETKRQKFLAEAHAHAQNNLIDIKSDFNLFS